MATNYTGVANYPVPYNHSGNYPFSFAIALSTTENGTINNTKVVGPLPDQCYLVSLEAQSTDMDTNGSPLITLDIGFGTALGVIASGKKVLTASTIGQAGTSAAMGAGFMGLNIGGLYLIVAIAAAPATAAAGTVTVVGTYASGLKPITVT